jgi:hypothetical protein
MSMIIYMDEYRTVKEAPATWLKNGTYGEEVMQAGWNPAVVNMLREPLPAPSPDLPYDLATIDVDAFLDRIYGLATTI